MTDLRGTGLHLACEMGHKKIVKLLLDHKASLELEDTHRKIALEYATNKRILEMIPQFSGEELLEKYSKNGNLDKPSSFSGQVY